MTETPISLAGVRALEVRAIPTRPFSPPALFVRMPPEVRDALVEAVSAAQALCARSGVSDMEDHIETWRVPRHNAVRLDAALSRFVSEQPPNGDKGSETTP